MRRIIKAFMQNASTASKFQFSLRCAVCGSLWKSRPAYFSKAEVQPENEGKHVIFQALYQRERDDARERAVTEALEHFSRCHLQAAGLRPLFPVGRGYRPVCGLCGILAGKRRVGGKPVGEKRLKREDRA